MANVAPVPGLTRDLHVNANMRSRVKPGTAEV